MNPQLGHHPIMQAQLGASVFSMFSANKLQDILKQGVNTAINEGKSNVIAAAAASVVNNPQVQQATQQQLEKSYSKQLADEIIRLKNQSTQFITENPKSSAAILVVGGVLAVGGLMLLLRRR